jgi:hypothetical protein
LTRASELNDKALYEQAYTLAKEVIDNGPFELSKDFASVFDMENSDGNGNKEVIWYIDYSSTNQLYNQEMDNDIIRFIIFILYQLKFYIQTKYKLFCHRKRNTSSLFGIIIINLAESKEILCCSIYTEFG